MLRLGPAIPKSLLPKGRGLDFYIPRVGKDFYAPRVNADFYIPKVRGHL